MHSRSQRNRSAQRSGLYSEFKYSNWRAFDPFGAEINLLHTTLAKPTRTLSLTNSECGLYQRELHAEFIRPFSIDDAKQVKTSLGRLFRWGQYSHGSIYLFAYPSKTLRIRFRRPPSTERMIEFELARPKVKQSGAHWICEFTEERLRRFYLYDVLLHEIGHHVDRHSLNKKPSRDAERYAEWFASMYGRPFRWGHQKRVAALH